MRENTNQPNYQVAIVFAIGAFIFLLAALWALPFLFVAPHTFNLYFFLGSLFLQLALGFYYGPKQYVTSLLTKENMVFSAVYCAYIGLNFYFMVAGTVGTIFTLSVVAV